VVAEAAFNIVIERKQWPDLLDFGPALQTWREFRADLASGVSALEWTRVGAFYSNLERSARMVRHGEPATDGDLKVAAMQVSYAEQAREVAAKHTARNKKEQDELIEELTPPKNED
jgi:hypothetical protein